jgi:hypothetical protein
MRIKNTNQLIIASVSLIALASQVQAEEKEPDKFRFAIGGYALVKYDSNISMTDPDLGAGISINPQDTLGMDFENTVLRIEGYYRFHPKHALTYAWYSIDSIGSKTISKGFDWPPPGGGAPIPIEAGAQVVSSLEYDIFKVGYLWSFHHTDKVELGFGAGLHITRLKMGLDATLKNQSKPSLQNVDTTVPLPVFSLVLNYNVTPKLHWYLKTEAFVVKFDNWTGSYRDATLGLEYRAWKHVALGAGLSSNSLEIEEDDPQHRLRFDNSIGGALLYVATYF